MKKVHLTINRKTVEAREGMTILQTARSSGIDIPTLCYLKGLSPWGGCRLCIVEIEGSAKVVPSCSTPATDGTKIITNSDRLHRLRKATLELLFSERNHICPMCAYNKGDCGLQHQGYVHGLTGVPYQYLYPNLPVDLTARYFGMDHNRCILCTRCVRACDEMEGTHTLDIAGRGQHNRVVVDLDTTFGASETCTSCGACVASCPTGALFDKAAAFRGKLNRSTQHPTICGECPVGCGLTVYVQQGRVVNVMGDLESPVNHGHLCVRGRYETWAEPRERLAHPTLRAIHQPKPVTWDEASRAIAEATRGLAPEQMALLVSPRLTHEEAKAVQALAPRFGRVGMAAGRHEAALCRVARESTSKIEDLAHADAIILLGAQPSQTHGVVAARIRTQVRKHGARLLIFQARKSDLDACAEICAHMVSLDHALWDRVGAVLRTARHPVLVYGAGAMTDDGVTVMERLIEILESNDQAQSPILLPLPEGSNSVALVAAGIEPVEDVSAWLEASPVQYLHIIAGDAPDGGAHLLREKQATAAFQSAACLVVQASYRSALSNMAHVVLPSAIWCERGGTVTNLEGRDLEFRPILPPAGEARGNQAILKEIFR